MAKKNLINTAGTFIALNKTPILYIGGAILVVGIGALVYKRIKKVLNPSVPSAKDYSSLNNIKVNTSNTTFSEQQAKQYSNQLVNHFSTSGGTDEKGIRNVFEKVKTKDDMNLLIKAFGVRPYSWLNSGEASGFLYGIPEKVGGFGNLDLVGWLDAELGVFDWKTKRLVNEKLELVGLSI